jgi:DNA-binding CsgD family transcriptional regulator
MERDNGLSSTESGLEALRPQDTKILREAIASASERRLDSCLTLMLPRTGGSRPLTVHVPPVRVSQDASGHVTVIVSDPDQPLVLQQDTLSRLYGLTRAEASIAMLLLQGRSLEEAAVSLFVSIHTVRTHVKRIMLKTDTGRQGELLRLLLTPAAQMRLD